MSNIPGPASALADAHLYFKRTISVFGPEDAAFTPDPELYTVVGHIAQRTAQWGADGPT